MGQGALVGLPDQGRVLAQNPCPVTGLWRTPGSTPAGEFLFVYPQADRRHLGVDVDQVAIDHQSQRPADRCLGRGITDAQAAGRARDSE